MFPRAPNSDEEVVDPSAIIRLGIVASVDLANATVEVDCGEVRTAPISFVMGRAGQTRIWSPPSEGEQIVLLCPGGDIEAAIAVSGLARALFPPAGNSLRELIQFQDNALIAYDPEAHHFDIDLPAGATATIKADGGLSIEGDVTLTGDLDVSGSITAADDISTTADVLADGTSLSGHKHTGVASGSAISGPPQ